MKNVPKQKIIGAQSQRYKNLQTLGCKKKKTIRWRRPSLSGSDEFGLLANGLGHGFVAVPLEQLGQFPLDLADHRRPVVRERRVDLDERGAGLDLHVGVGAVEDAAHADYRDSAAGQPVHLRDHLGRQLGDRGAAEAARFVFGLLERYTDWWLVRLGFETNWAV